jgi:hypothetical protein
MRKNNFLIEPVGMIFKRVNLGMGAQLEVPSSIWDLIVYSIPIDLLMAVSSSTSSL